MPSKGVPHHGGGTIRAVAPHHSHPFGVLRAQHLHNTSNPTVRAPTHTLKQRPPSCALEQSRSFEASSWRNRGGQCGS